jgi:hypothetical protein
MDRFSETSPLDLISKERLHHMGDDERIEPEILRCDSCDHSVEELFPCYWESSIEVGPCCLVHTDEQPLCSVALEIVLAAKTVRQFVVEIQNHLQSCQNCGQQPIARKDVQSDNTAPSGSQGEVA